jgi:hypothetical protein
VYRSGNSLYFISEWLFRLFDEGKIVLASTFGRFGSQTRKKHSQPQTGAAGGGFGGGLAEAERDAHPEAFAEIGAMFQLGLWRGAFSLSGANAAGCRNEHDNTETATTTETTSKTMICRCRPATIPKVASTIAESSQ